MVNKIDFTWNEIKIIIGIKNCETPKEITINEIAKNIGINRNHPIFYKILNYLIDNEMMVLVRVIGTTKFFKIRYNKIKDLLDEQERINYLIAGYINKDHIFEW